MIYKIQTKNIVVHVIEEICNGRIIENREMTITLVDRVVILDSGLMGICGISQNRWWYF